MILFGENRVTIERILIYKVNNKQFFQNRNCKIVDTIKTNLFDINGYLIGEPF